MSKQNNLKDYLTDLYQGIVSKKPDASRNPQDFRSEIESIETECSENHIVEVTELPTENIDKNAVYYIPSENSHYRYEKCTEIVTYMGDGGAIPLGDYPLTIVSTKPTANIKAYTDTYKHIYYVENENDMFMYTLSETTGAYEWASVSALFGVTFKGFVDTSSEAGEEGLFAVSPHYEWFKYYIPSGDLKITENGTFDVTEVAEVVVNVPNTIPDGYIQPSGDLEITSNGTKDVTNYASVTVNVPTSGGGSTECSGNHIIEVDTLPTENIDETALYKVGDSYYKFGNEFKDVLIVAGGVPNSVVELLTQEGGTVELFYVDNYGNVTDIHPFDEATMTIPAYYDASRDDVFIYMDGAWVSYSQLEGAINGGAITDISEAITDGYYYALLDNGWKLYGNPSIIEVYNLPEVGVEGAIYSVPEVIALVAVFYDTSTDIGSPTVITRNCRTVKTLPEIGFEHITYIAENDNKVYSYSYSNGWSVLCSRSNRIYSITDTSGLENGYYVYISPVQYQFVDGEYRQMPVKKTVFQFTSNGDGTCSVCGSDPLSNDLDIVFPSTSPTGETVTSIENSAFGRNLYLLNVENIIIPDSVISVPKFKGLSALKSVVIGNSLSSIDESAFKDCTSLKTVVIGRVVTSIGDDAFSGCINLENIIFKGTTAQWGYVSLGTNWNTNVPATKITCSDGTVPI